MTGIGFLRSHPVEVDPWVGPRLKARNLDDSLRRIKPKNCRVIIRKRRELEKRHGQRVQGIHLSRGIRHTILVRPDIEKEDIAHEFGHAALKHKPWKKTSVTEHMKMELNAWRWASEHWAKPNNIKSGVLKERKRWIAHVVEQTMQVEKTDMYSTIKAIENQMRLLKMEPLTNKEAEWIIKEVKVEDKALRKSGWEPKYSIEFRKK